MATDTKLAMYTKIEDTPEISIHGQVFTKPHIVELILDLVGYSQHQSLESKRLLDAGCGDGRFLVAAVKRLLHSLNGNRSVSKLTSALLGVEKDPLLADECKRKITTYLISVGVSNKLSTQLADSWVVCDDFLMHEFDATFDFVVGNPPYVRQEAIPKQILKKYRTRFPCLYDRADLYVVFFEYGLRLLKEKGVLGFICPDRFIRNKYGGPLRELIANDYCVRSVIDLSTTEPFDFYVSSYPGIFVVSREKQQKVDFFRLKNASKKECNSITKIVEGNHKASKKEIQYHKYDEWFSGSCQWTLESPKHLNLLQKLESNTVAMGNENSGCKVSIGVATGADRIFIVEREDIEIEEELLLPLATTKDIDTGIVDWKGKYLVNPFRSDDSGELINLSDFPKAKKYFQSHEEKLTSRNVGKRNPTRWYRTIDRVHTSLTQKKKLLIPDIKAKNLVVYEDGKLYPHHNLYYIVSETWNLRALQAILRSSIAKFFVWMYGVKMRGGYLRFQAQYLRKICIPKIDTLSEERLLELSNLAEDGDLDTLDITVAKVYGITKKELLLIQSLSNQL